MRDIQSNERQDSRVQVVTEMAIDGLFFRARALVLIARVPIVHHEFVAITKCRSRISRSKASHLDDWVCVTEAWILKGSIG